MVAHGLALSLVNVDAEYLQGLDIVVERLALGLYAVCGEGGGYLLKGQPVLVVGAFKHYPHQVQQPDFLIYASCHQISSVRKVIKHIIPYRKYQKTDFAIKFIITHIQTLCKGNRCGQKRLKK